MDLTQSMPNGKLKHWRLFHRKSSNTNAGWNINKRSRSMGTIGMRKLTLPSPTVGDFQCLDASFMRQVERVEACLRVNIM